MRKHCGVGSTFIDSKSGDVMFSLYAKPVGLLLCLQALRAAPTNSPFHEMHDSCVCVPIG